MHGPSLSKLTSQAEIYWSTRTPQKPVFGLNLTLWIVLMLSRFVSSYESFHKNFLIIINFTLKTDGNISPLGQLIIGQRFDTRRAESLLRSRWWCKVWNVDLCEILTSLAIVSIKIQWSSSANGLTWAMVSLLVEVEDVPLANHHWALCVPRRARSI